MNLNKAMLIGNLTRDPEVRTTPTGQTVANFGVATNRVWTDQQGQKQSQVEYHNIVMWRRLAEIAGQYLKKGAKVYIEGRLQTRDWMDPQTNTKRYMTEIIADNMIMLGGQGGGQNFGNGGGGFTPSAGAPYNPPQQNTQTPVSNEPPVIDVNADMANNQASTSNFAPDEEEIKVEDIPF